LLSAEQYNRLRLDDERGLADAYETLRRLQK
jgi:hypothetical protein